MKAAILILAATALSAQPPAQQSKQPAPPRDGIPSSHGDDTRGYNDTPPLPGQKWKVHAKERPPAPKVTPGPLTSAGPPSAACVLFGAKESAPSARPAPARQPTAPRAHA